LDPIRDDVTEEGPLPEDLQDLDSVSAITTRLDIEDIQSVYTHVVTIRWLAVVTMDNIHVNVDW